MINTFAWRSCSCGSGLRLCGSSELDAEVADVRESKPYSMVRNLFSLGAGAASRYQLSRVELLKNEARDDRTAAAAEGNAKNSPPTAGNA